MYNYTHYGMGFTMEDLTLRTSRPAGATTPEFGIMATYSTD
jgi:hypothetical protein